MKSICFIFIFLLTISQAWATWSIVVSDPNTGEIGSAGASWSPGVWMIVHPAPGKGMVVAQATTNIAAGRLAAFLLTKGEKPDAIMQRITQPAFDPKWQQQQYAIVSLDGTVATFTGTECPSWAGAVSQQGVSVQGNLLVEAQVIHATFAAYLSARKDGKSMAESLLVAMEAGAAYGGDKRAGPKGWEAGLTAYLIVNQANDPARRPSFALVASPPPKGGNPITELRKQFDSLVAQRGNALPKHPLYFPDDRIIWGVFLGIPILSGVFLSFFFRAWKAVLFPSIASLILYTVFMLIASGMGCVIPCYDFLAWGIPIFIAVLTTILSAAILFVRMLAKKFWTSKIFQTLCGKSQD